MTEGHLDYIYRRGLPQSYTPGGYSIGTLDLMLQPCYMRAHTFILWLIGMGIPLEQINTTDFHSCTPRVVIDTPYPNHRQRSYVRWSLRDARSAVSFYRKCTGATLSANW